jgi:Fic family protein
MSYKDTITQIDALQQKINAHGTLTEEVKKKINYKIRLDWNYYSNRMEGGTLTREETRSVMVGNIDVKGKPLKDVWEMNGHDKVVLDILKIGKGEMRIAEKRIKEVHKAIMHEDDAIKLPLIGNWKTTPNEIINYKDEKISFTPPNEVPVAMHSLLDKTNAELDAFFAGRESLHPLIIASQFHIGYVTIHPFYDGNGRTARIFTNLLLICCGLPPIIIKDANKKAYYQLLADIQAYGGNPELFYAFIGERILESQKLVLDAIEGKEIEEPEDLDKKLALLEMELETVDPNEEIKKEFSKEVLLEIYDSWFTQLMTELIPVIQKFNRFFKGNRHHMAIQNGMGSVQFNDEPALEVIGKLRLEFINIGNMFNQYDCRIMMQTGFGPFIKSGLKSFGCVYGFEIKFHQIKYEVMVDDFSDNEQRKQVKLYERLLHKPLNEVEIKKIVTQLSNAIYQHIDFYTKKNGLR